MIKNTRFKAQIDPHATADQVIGAYPLTTESTADLLRHILARAEGNTVAFDLDSTLLNNRPRSARIMREFGQEQQHSLLQRAHESHWESWSAEQAMKNLGLVDTEVTHLIDDYYAFWAPRFFSSAYCSEDIPVDGAKDFVACVLAEGANVVYLTGRDETMRDGTLASLHSLGFPTPDRCTCELIMKSEPTESDDVYKERSISGVTGYGELLAAFDNEPTHINLYRSAFPNAASVHLLTDHSGRSVRLYPGIFSIHSFASFTFV